MAADGPVRHQREKSIQSRPAIEERISGAPQLRASSGAADGVADVIVERVELLLESTTWRAAFGARGLSMAWRPRFFPCRSSR